MLPSGWHCLGLVKHLTLADEHYWFSGILGGEPLNFFPEGPNADWQLDPHDNTESILAKYRHEISSSNAIINATQPDQRPRPRDPAWDQWGVDFPNVRTVMLHMIVETATHAGHLDAVRELLDGHQRLVM